MIEGRGEGDPEERAEQYAQADSEGGEKGEIREGQ